MTLQILLTISEIGQNLATPFNTPWSFDGTHIDEIAPNFETTIEEITKLCNDIETHKSSAIELLSSKVLKDAFCILTHQFTHLINLVSQKGIFPETWKSAKVIPLFKGGDKSKVSNYRPISLLPLPSKIIEKVIHSRLTEFYSIHNILTDNQDGFRKGRSTIDTIANFTDDISVNINKGECTLAAFVDFKKAFDTVYHDILIQKLKYTGVQGKNLDLLTNYLSNRSQITFANSKIASSHAISCGVPKGSILGPLLFLVYINDFTNVLRNTPTRLYADDTVVYINDVNVKLEQNLQISLNKLHLWCNKNKLTINIGKTKTMIFGSRKYVKQMHAVKLDINNIQLECVHTFKYLGVTLDMELKYNAHASTVYKLASHKVNTLRLIRPYIDEQTALQIYKMKILPYIDYGDIFYMSANNESLEALQKVQYRAIRTCLKTDIRTARIELLNRAQLPLLAFRRTVHLRNYMYKRSKNKKYLAPKTVNTRIHQAPVLTVPKSDTNALDRSILVKGGVEWNNLDLENRNSESYDSFKRKQRKWLNSKIP